MTQTNPDDSGQLGRRCATSQHPRARRHENGIELGKPMPPRTAAERGRRQIRGQPSTIRYETRCIRACNIKNLLSVTRLISTRTTGWAVFLRVRSRFSLTLALLSFYRSFIPRCRMPTVLRFQFDGRLRLFPRRSHLYMYVNSETALQRSTLGMHISVV